MNVSCSIRWTAAARPKAGGLPWTGQLAPPMMNGRGTVAAEWAKQEQR